MQTLTPHHPNKQVKDKRRKKGPAAVLALCKGLAAALLVVVALQYFQVKIYKFPHPEPFTGDSLYNPYKNASGQWLKANFHAHSIAWEGVTNGKQHADEVVNKYRDFGYDVAGVSNYQSIYRQDAASQTADLPIYEHGVNISKVHQLVIGSSKVNFFDVMFWQTASIRQYIIDQLKTGDAIICINHPSVRNGYPLSNFSKLSGYDCIELLNKSRVSDKQWDAALSAGKPVWLLANDDCHNVDGHGFARSWTLVNAGNHAQSLLKAIESGNSIGVCRKKMFGNEDSLKYWLKNNNGLLLKRIETSGLQVSYYFTKTVDKITLIGQDGLVKARASNTNQLSYQFTNTDSYIRAEIETEKFKIFLNPVIRTNGGQAPVNFMNAQVRILPTLAMRTAIIVVLIVMMLLLYPGVIRKLFMGKARAKLPANRGLSLQVSRHAY